MKQDDKDGAYERKEKCENKNSDKNHLTEQ
jgi:hypothetical protein